MCIDVLPQMNTGSRRSRIVIAETLALSPPRSFTPSLLVPSENLGEPGDPRCLPALLFPDIMSANDAQESSLGRSSAHISRFQ
jgi:hypothetical protein